MKWIVIPVFVVSWAFIAWGLLKAGHNLKHANAYTFNEPHPRKWWLGKCDFCKRLNSARNN